MHRPLLSFKTLAHLALLLTLLLPATRSRAQAPAWQSVLTTPDGYGYVNAMATDAAGYVYLAGAFNGNITFGQTTLICAGFADAFVAKWDPRTNTFVWAKRAGGPDDDYAYAVAVSGSNVYVAGGFSSTSATFGTTALTNQQPSSAPFYQRADGFVTKLVDNGTDASFAWTQAAGGLGYDNIDALAVSGNTVYLAGRYGAPSATFGGLTVANNGFGTQLNTDMFVARLDDAGNSGTFAWVQRGGGSGTDYANRLAVRGSTVYITGSYQGMGTFGSTSLSGASFTNVFVSKLSDAGTSASFAWTQGLGGSDPMGLAVSGSNVYVAGMFTGTGLFGSVALSSAGSTDAFVAKLSDLGTAATTAWAIRAGGTGYDGAYALTLNGPDVYITGGFLSPTATFGSTVLTNIDPAAGSSTGSYPDVYVSKLSDAGSFVWTQQAGSPRTDHGLAIASVGSVVYVAGATTTPATFAPFQLNATQNYYLPFVASIGTGPLASHSASNWVGRVYPNPARGTTSVPLPAVAGISHATLTLSNAIGQVVRTHRVALLPAASTYALDLAGLPKGIYSLRLQAGTTVAVEKLQVE